MKPSEKTGLVALVVFFAFLFIAYLSPIAFAVVGLAIVASGFALFATLLQHREERQGGRE